MIVYLNVFIIKFNRKGSGHISLEMKKNTEAEYENLSYAFVKSCNFNFNFKLNILKKYIYISQKLPAIFKKKSSNYDFF